MAEGKNGRRILTPLFWTFFWTFKNVHFALCASLILKYEMQTPKNRVCDHYALKTHLRPQKTVTELFEGIGSPSQTGGGKMDIFV